MIRAVVGALAGLLLGGCAAGLPPKAAWNDVEALEREGDRKAATERLHKRGRKGLEALVLAARSLGDERALTLLNKVEAGIFGFPLHAIVEHEHSWTPAGQAVLTAFRWLSDDLDRAMELARSDDWFQRALAVMSQHKNPAGLWEVLEALDQESHPKVTEVMVAVLQDAGKHTEGPWFQRLAERAAQLEIAETWSDQRCKDDPSGFARLVDQVGTGQVAKGSHSSRDNALLVHLKRPDGREIAIGPACALDLYQSLAAKGKRQPELILPLLHWGVVAPAQKRQAVEWVLADLELIPQEKRNLTLARIVNAGGQIPQPIQPVDTVHGFEVAEILEAMARKDPEAARSQVERYWLCSDVFGKADLIALSAFAKSPELSQNVYEIGLHCEHGLEPALIALVRMGDTRAMKLLDKRLGKNFPPISTEVIYALREHRTEALAEHLKALAASGNAQAKRILSTW